jgi:hypothetical protein
VDQAANRTLALTFNLTVFFPNNNSGGEGSFHLERTGLLKRGGLWIYDRRYDNGFGLFDGLGNLATGAAITNPTAAQVIDGKRIAGRWDVKDAAWKCNDEKAKDGGPTPAGWYFLSERPFGERDDVGFSWTKNQGWTDQGNLLRDQTKFPYPLTSRNAKFVEHSDKLIQGRQSVWKDDIGEVAVGSCGLKTYDAEKHGPQRPKSACFKFDILPDRVLKISNTKSITRDNMQVHPDGYPKGTHGCIGLQEYHEAIRVEYLMRHLQGIGLHVRNPVTNAWNSGKALPITEN